MVRWYAHAYSATQWTALALTLTLTLTQTLAPTPTLTLTLARHERRFLFDETRGGRFARDEAWGWSTEATGWP